MKFNLKWFSYFAFPLLMYYSLILFMYVTGNIAAFEPSSFGFAILSLLFGIFSAMWFISDTESWNVDLTKIFKRDKYKKH